MSDDLWKWLGGDLHRHTEFLLITWPWESVQPLLLLLSPPLCCSNPEQYRSLSHQRKAYTNTFLSQRQGTLRLRPLALQQGQRYNYPPFRSTPDILPFRFSQEPSALPSDARSELPSLTPFSPNPRLRTFARVSHIFPDHHSCLYTLRSAPPRSCRWKPFPARTPRKLVMNKQGCDWMRRRWPVPRLQSDRAWH